MANESERARGEQGRSARETPATTTGGRGGAQSPPGQGAERRGGRQVGAARRQSWLPSQPRGPFTFIRRVAEEMDRLFEDIGMPGGGSFDEGRLTDTGWNPHVEASAKGDTFVVRVDLPGVERGDATVEIDDDALVVAGERRREDRQEHEGYFTTELEYGSFARRIPLPQGVDSEAAHATFRNGVLVIEMPLKPEARRGRRVEIREGGGTEEAGTQTTTSTGSTSGGAAPTGGAGGGSPTGR